MATDPVTSPSTSYGQIFYGVTLGIITILIRYLTPYPEGVMTSILFMNMFVPLYDRLGLTIKNKFKLSKDGSHMRIFSYIGTILF
jgi:Na+-translocating ferredoxin:NAD+ oxidoreductase RnfD subunit